MIQIFKLKITRINARGFTDRETGEQVPFVWVTGDRDDGVTVQVGSAVTTYEVGDEVTMHVEKRLGNDGKSRFIEVVDHTQGE